MVNLEMFFTLLSLASLNIHKISMLPVAYQSIQPQKPLTILLCPSLSLSCPWSTILVENIAVLSAYIILESYFHLPIDPGL